MPVNPGQIARIRSRRYLIEEVVAPPTPRDQTLVRAACLDDDAQGERLEVLWEREVDAEVLGEASWKQVAEKGFDPPRIFSAYLHTLRWNCVTATDPRKYAIDSHLTRIVRDLAPRFDQMTAVARAAEGLPDARIVKLVDWIRQNLCPGLAPLGSHARPQPARVARPERRSRKRCLMSSSSPPLISTGPSCSVPSTFQR